MITDLPWIKRNVFLGLFLFTVSCAIYVPSLSNRFVWDDHPLIENRYSSKEGGILSLKQFIPASRENYKSLHYRPVMRVSQNVDYSLWGLSPFGFHLTSVFLNSLSVVAFYALVLALLGELGVGERGAKAFLCSLLFALFPLHVEPVSWISGRADLLYSLFFFLAVIFHILSYRNIWFLALTAISFYLSLLSKETAVVFPIIVLGLDILSRKAKDRRNLLRYPAYAILLLFYLYVRQRAYVLLPELPTLAGPNTGSFSAGQGAAQHTGTLISQVWHLSEGFLSSYLFYIKKLIYPFDLNAFIAEVPHGNFYLIISVITFIFLILIFFITIRKREAFVAFSIYWVFVMLFPLSMVAIFSVATAPLAERYLYLVSAGFCMLIGFLIVEYGRSLKYKKLGWIYGGLLCLLYLWFTVGRQGVWKDDVSVWADSSIKNPQSYLAHANYAVALERASETDKAIGEYLAALSLVGESSIDEARDKARLANMLAVLYIEKKEDDNSAEKVLKDSLGYDPTYAATYYNLGFIYLKKGLTRGASSNFRNSEKYLERALQLADDRSVRTEVERLLSTVHYYDSGAKTNGEEHSN